MSAKRTRIERRIQISGVLILLGLLVELITLFWSHPTAFIFFLFIGGTLMAVGILFYLYSLIATDLSAPRNDTEIIAEK